MKKKKTRAFEAPKSLLSRAADMGHTAARHCAPPGRGAGITGGISTIFAASESLRGAALSTRDRPFWAVLGCVRVLFKAFEGPRGLSSALSGLLTRPERALEEELFFGLFWQKPCMERRRGGGGGGGVASPRKDAKDAQTGPFHGLFMAFSWPFHGFCRASGPKVKPFCGSTTSREPC